MALFLLNSIITPFKDQRAVFEIKRISVEEAKKIVQSKPDFISAIGHGVTAYALTLLLGVNVPVNRTEIYFGAGDEAVALVLKKRLAEGQTLKTIEELERVGYELFYVRRVE